jgi:hypothetical protein
LQGHAGLPSCLSFDRQLKKIASHMTSYIYKKKEDFQMEIISELMLSMNELSKP